MVKVALGHKKKKERREKEEKSKKEREKGKGKLSPVASHEKKQQGSADKYPSLCVFSDAAGDSLCNTFPIVTIRFPSGPAQPPSWLFLLTKLSEMTRSGAGTARCLAVDLYG